MENNSPKPRITEIEEHSYGLLFWEYKGRYLADNDGNYLVSHVPSPTRNLALHMKGKRLMEQAAKELGFTEGKAVYKSGYRGVTDAEYDLMMERLHNGEIPDPADPGNWSTA